MSNYKHYFEDFHFIEQDRNARSLSFYCKKDLSCIDKDIIDELKQVAFMDGGNARISLHATPEADLHNMIIFQHHKAYTRPHKHVSKSETYHIVEGEVALFVFDDEGTVIERFDMSLQKKIICRIEKNYYHTLIPLSNFVIFLESRPGPFLRESDSFFPQWSIEVDDKNKIADFINTILKFKT